MKRICAYLTIPLMICSLILSLVNGTIWCNNSYSCALTSVQESTSGTVNCYGFYSCYKSPKIVNAVGYAFCDGSYSCYKADEVFAANVNWGQCSGLYSCREIGNYTVKYAHVCESEQYVVIVDYIHKFQIIFGDEVHDV